MVENARETRVPKACNQCRRSKLKCDGIEPCTRCTRLSKDCIYLPTSKVSTEDKLLDLQHEIAELKQRARNDAISPAAQYVHRIAPALSAGQFPISNSSPPERDQSVTSPVSVLGQGRKRKRSRLDVRQDNQPDFITRGLVSVQAARLAFEAFFAGCDRFVPVFDPAHDTFESVRQRSSFLFDAICTTGCTVSDGETQLPHMLNYELKKLLNQVVILHHPLSLETVQALLVIACYSPERSLILSLATRLALDIDLPSAFDEMISGLVINAPEDNEAHLVRCARTWFELLVLENMLQVDAGKLPAFKPQGPIRRCRVLLQKSQTTPLDLRLLSQVELNYLRTDVNTDLASYDGGPEEDVLTAVGNLRIDIELWYSDWKSLMESSTIAGSELPLLQVNLKVQKHWSEAMAYFRALKCLGTENVDAMTSTGKTVLGLAKSALRSHLSTTLEEPNYYLPNLRFAMDFVWAKCSFCFLLLLKLTRLLPESQEDNYRLLEEGNQLYRQLSNAGNCAGSSTSRLYVQVLRMSLETYNRALQQHYDPQGVATATASTFFWESSDANLELQNFVPEQFVFEWNFPGLTLFSSPTAWQDFFDDYVMGFNRENHDDAAQQAP